MSSAKLELYLLCVLTFAVCGAVIWIRTNTVKGTYRYVQQEKEYRTLLQDLQARRVEWLKATSPARLEVLAQNLGLEPPKPDQILKYENSTRVR